MLIIDNTAGGLCMDVGGPCIHDKYALCMNVDVGIDGYGMCMCRTGSHLYSGFCRPGKQIQKIHLEPNVKNVCLIDK